MATVLVVEDDDSSRLLIKHILRSGGHRVIETKNGDEAVAELRNGLPDLVITDLLMPRMSGQELMAMIRNDFSQDLPIIVVSAAYIEADIGVKLYKLGMAVFFSKPYTASALLNAIKEVLSPTPVSA